MKTSLLTILLKTVFTLIIIIGNSAIGFSQIWTPLTTNTQESLKAVSFVNAQTGWIAGTNGTILKTTDAGLNWTDQSIAITQTFRCLHFVNNMIGWAAGDSGVVYNTIDGGANWQAQNSNSVKQLNAIKFLNNTTGWLVGNSVSPSMPTIRKTVDGGANWTAVVAASINSSLWGLSIIDAQNIWVSGTSKRIANTADGGSIWTNETVLPGGGITIYNDIQMLNGSLGWGVNSFGNSNGNIAKYTTVGGWQGQTSGTTADLLSLSFVDANIGWVSGRNGTILSTPNGGSNWNQDASGTTKSLWDIQFINDTTGWTVGDSGVALKYQKFTPTMPLTLIQPVGGENFLIGSTQSISFYTDNTINNINIEYSTNNGFSWNPIVNNYAVPVGFSSYPWVVAGPASLTALVRISKTTNLSVTDMSPANFNLLETPVGKEYAVLLTATSNNSPSQITINWTNDPTAIAYSIDRKLKADTAWTFLANLAPSASTYTDLTVNVGEAFEYRVTKTTPILSGYGYIYAGLELGETDFRGEILLLVDANFNSTVATEVQQLELDLIGDGYLVKKQIVNPSIGVAAIKNIIVQEYTNSSGLLSTVLTIGHMPAPYSGDFAPDGHAERVGAQPADGFYGDIDGVWTDNTVATSNTGQIHTPNSIGDGYYDQSTFPSLVDLQVGRIDMDKMSGFVLSESNLIKQYLTKNHDYRFAITQPNYRALMNTTMDDLIPYTSAAAWRSFSTMFGNSIKEITGCNTGCTEFIDSLSNENYLWTHMAGGGSDTSMSNTIFTSSQCINRPINTVFMQMYGSYFVEWYKGGISTTTNHLLRAPLASNGTALATMWSGKAPFWHFHHMSLGETVGYSTLRNQNNYSTYDAGSINNQRQVHMALMGDPTLKQHIVLPVSNVIVTPNGNNIDITWSASLDNVVGYNVYRADSLYGMFSKINSSYITGTNFTDNAPLQGSNVYMVRAVKLENRPSGTYYNLSLGVIDSTNIVLEIDGLNTATISIAVLPNPSNGAFNLRVKSKSDLNSKVSVFNALGQEIFSNNYSFTTGYNLIPINISSYTNGIYTVLINDEKGNIMKQKIILNK